MGGLESAAQIAGQIRDLHDDTLDAWFAILDREGRYTCPECRKTQTFAPGLHPDAP